jgi:hypothetical protein
VILVVDRTELEGQLKGWVERLLSEMKALDIVTERADSKAKLQSLLDADFRGLIVAMIHKFEAIRKNSCMRDNVFVFIDEAHRSVAKDLGSYMMAAVPNATIIGFTGTPIAKTPQGEGTFKIFGSEDEHGYLDKSANSCSFALNRSRNASLSAFIPPAGRPAIEAFLRLAASCFSVMRLGPRFMDFAPEFGRHRRPARCPGVRIIPISRLLALRTGSRLTFSSPIRLDTAPKSSSSKQ